MSNTFCYTPYKFLNVGLKFNKSQNFLKRFFHNTVEVKPKLVKKKDSDLYFSLVILQIYHPDF